MQEASLEDEAQDAGTAHLLLLPSQGPVIKDVLGDVHGRVAGGEDEVLCLPTDQDKTQIHHIEIPCSCHGSEADLNRTECTALRWMRPGQPPGIKSTVCVPLLSPLSFSAFNNLLKRADKVNKSVAIFARSCDICERWRLVGSKLICPIIHSLLDSRYLASIWLEIS